jgi:fido (protein-threonine AMPylation protein)
MSEFDEYKVHGEPEQIEKARAWQTAVGLQDVDGLKVSPYLVDTARRHIEGDVTIDEARQLIRTYYETKSAHDAPNDTEEADKVSSNIVKLLNEPSFAFSFIGLTSIHRRIFEGVFKFAGQLRQVDITKKEWVLRGASVFYQPSEDIQRSIEYDLTQEREFNYENQSVSEIIVHLACFISNLWQIHPFREGNTRTTAVFLIKYLRSMGVQADNTLFGQHSWYFRNAMVRASYKDFRTQPTTEFLELFLRNLILGETNELSNRRMLISEDVSNKNTSVPVKSIINQTQSVKIELTNHPKSHFDTLKCTLQELALLQAIEQRPEITQVELATILGKSLATIKRLTGALSAREILIREHGKRHGCWKIIQPTSLQTKC